MLSYPTRLFHRSQIFHSALFRPLSQEVHPFVSDADGENGDTLDNDVLSLSSFLTFYILKEVLIRFDLRTSKRLSSQEVRQAWYILLMHQRRKSLEHF